MSQKTADIKEDLLWARYREQSDISSRDKIIEQYTSVVRMVAASLYAQRPDDEVEFKELFQLGMVGLIESIDRYDPERGASFSTYASYRIRGAILNGLEKVTERREQAAFRSRIRKERVESITIQDGPREASLFEEMVEVSVGLAICYMLEDTGLVQNESGIISNNAYEASELNFIRDRLLAAVENLPEREQFLIKQHYFEYHEFNVIAEVMGVTKGRVSQLHKRALKLLRDSIKENSSLDESF